MSETVAESPKSGEVEVAATPPSAEPEQTPPETTQAQGSEAKDTQTAPAEETFFSGDVNSLPPKLRESYENMNRDYKEKTAKLAEERRQSEGLKEKAGYYDQLASDPEFVKLYQQHRNVKQTPDAGEPEKEQGFRVTQEDLDAISTGDVGKFQQLLDRHHDSKNSGMKKELENAQQSIQKSQASDVLNEYAQATNADGKLSHPRFNEFSDIGLVNYFLNQDAPRNEAEWAMKLDKAYKNSEKMYDGIFQKGKKEGLGGLQKKSDESTETPSLSPSGMSVIAADPTKISIEEAVAAAKRGQRLT